MKIVKLLLFSVTLFSLGFLANAFLFQKTVSDISSLSQTNVLRQSSADEFITGVDYDGKRFKPSSVTITIGNYITITNQSKKELMWLTSNLKDLNTVRGYGEGERLQAILTQKGEFKVMDKLTQSLLVVTVE